jgi:hypothetical protein
MVFSCFFQAIPYRIPYQVFFSRTDEEGGSPGENCGLFSAAAIRLHVFSLTALRRAALMGLVDDIKELVAAIKVWR